MKPSELLEAALERIEDHRDIYTCDAMSSVLHENTDASLRESQQDEVYKVAREKYLIKFADEGKTIESFSWFDTRDNRIEGIKNAIALAQSEGN